MIFMEKNLSNKVLKKSLNLFNNKYKFEILYYLNIKKKMRFGEIKIEIGLITQQLLTKLLKELEKDMLVNRNEYNGFPRKVEYTLTSFGKSTKPIINSILKWELNHIRLINKLMKKKITDSIYDYY